MDVRLRGERVLLQRSRELLVRADADLHLSGTADEPQLSGSFVLRNSVLAKRIEMLNLERDSSPRPSTSDRGIELFSFPESPLADLRFDVAVECEEPLRLKTNVASGALRPKLFLRGTGATPHLEGKVYFDPTTISLPGSTVKIESGTVTFDPADPLVPRVDVFGRARRLGVDVTLNINGPYDEPQITLSSVPPMTHEDILVLLITGQLAVDAYTDRGGREAGQTVAIYLGKDLLSKWLQGDATDDESFVERFEFESGRDVSRNGVPSLDVSYRLTQDVVREDDRLLLTLRRDVYEDYNLGVRLVFRLR